MFALIAGQGLLPGLVFQRLSKPHVVALEDFPPDMLTADTTFRIEHLGTMLSKLLDLGVSDVCFAGAIKRPHLVADFVDDATLPLVPKMMQAMKSGDDAALRTVIGFFENAGMKVHAVTDILPELLPKAGAGTNLKPTRDDADHISRAALVLNALGAADVGQSCVVHYGQAIAMEGTFGTDWMLESLKNRPDGRGGLLYKAPKPGQDRRIDLPTIGPETVKNASEAGLDGVVVDEGDVIVLDYDACVAAADEANMFLWVRKP